ncbi:hypothetical protein OG787_22870 [Streptomyces sp. NBC_00075]|uniref:Uncharacterized protein n=1 Tax=Streptomyces sp. NBC_00093 TaxID=2975649 RepID=A0AAU2A2T4_9ACTN
MAGAGAGAGVDVRVSRGEDGTVRIAVDGEVTAVDGEVAAVDGEVAAEEPDFTRAVLDVAGAVLTWPVLGTPGLLPSAEIHDPGRAQQWLWALYGERIAAAVHDRTTEDTTGESTGVRVTAHPTALAGSAARLALGHWAARWWPASYPDEIPALEPDLLGLELAALTHHCQQLFDGEGDFGDDQPDDCAAELIAEHEAALDPLLQWWRDTPQQADTASHLEGVLRLIDDAADTAGLDGPALRDLRSALDGRGPTGPWADLGALFARPGGYALAAGEPLGTGGRLIARGQGTNDWRRYPPGFVDAAENAVTWTARAVGARRRIEVEVVAHSTAPTTGAPLVAEVHVDGGDPHRVPLTRRDDLWTGRRELAPDLLAGIPAPIIEVGVLLPGFDPATGTPGDRAAREAVRALVRRRLTTATEPTTHDGSPHDTPSAPFLAETAAAATDEDY